MFLAQGVPGLVIALAIVSLAVHALQPLYQSATLLVVAYAMLFMPLALVSVRAAFMQAQPRLEETARALGLSWSQTLFRVMLPLAGPGLGAAAAMVFISVVTELNATLLLSPTRHANARDSGLGRHVDDGVRRRRALRGAADRHFAVRVGPAVRVARRSALLGERG